MLIRQFGFFLDLPKIETNAAEENIRNDHVQSCLN